MQADGSRRPNVIRTLERREAERVEILGTLNAEVLISQPIEVSELSRGGLQVLSRFPFVLDSLHEFRLALGAYVVVVKGRITHCSIIDINQERVEYQSGVDFTEVPRQIAEMIGDFASELQRRRTDKEPRATSD